MTTTVSKKTLLLAAGAALFLASIACQALFPKAVAPGSLEERVAEGNVRFEGTGNVTYIGCQDPTAVVILDIGAKTKELNGNTFTEEINPVSIDVITDGTQVKMETCQKSSVEDKYNWPAEGIYYPKEGKIIFYTCTQNDDKAEGNGFLVGEGFEGEYTCYDSDSGLMYEVAFSAYTMPGK